MKLAVNSNLALCGCWIHGTSTGVRRGFRIRDKETESPYLFHPLTYRQVYLTKVAYFGGKIHCVLEKMA